MSYSRGVTSDVLVLDEMDLPGAMLASNGSNRENFENSCIES